MNLNEYQDRTRTTAVYPNRKKEVDGLTYSILGLCGEVGELANKLKKHHRAGTPIDVYVLADELGDVMWYTASVAFELGMPLEEVADMNLTKLALRAKEKALVG